MAPRMHLPDWLREHAEAHVLRVLLRTLLTATAVVLAVDYSHIIAAVEDATPPLALPGNALPGVAPLHPGPGGNALLSKPMTFDLVANGRLMATGTIMPGTAKAFAREIAKRGTY